MLEENQIIVIAGEYYRVDLVNECRARVVPIRKKIKREFITLTGKKISFKTTSESLNISPNSEIKIIENDRT